MNRVKKIIFNLILGLVHIGAVGVLFWAFWPIAKWYLGYRPIWGVDFFLVASLAQLLNLHFVVPYALWDYAWFSGLPIFVYPILHSYVISLISYSHDLVTSVQYWAMASTFAFGVGAYFLFCAISRNPFISLVLAVAVLFSGGVYQTLTWAGSIPSYATQAMFPWALGFVVIYLRNHNYRYLLASALCGGIAVWGHPLVFAVYIVPAVVILVCFSFEKGLKIVEKFKTLFVFTLVSMVVALPIFYLTFLSSIKVALSTNNTQVALSTTSSETAQDIGAETFNKLQPGRMFGDNHITPFIIAGFCAGLFLFSFVLARRFKTLLAVLPYVVMSAYFAFYVWIFGQGISIFHGGWYRLFWHVPIWVGALACVLYKEALVNLFSIVKSKFLQVFLWVGCTFGISLVGVVFLFAYPYGSTITSIIYRSQVSSAHPDVLNLKITNKEREGLKKELLPSFINGDDTNWRLYTADQTINLWWTSLFKMPLARGYLDTDDREKGYGFWLDAAFSETDGEPQLVKSFDYPLQTTISNALFILDWTAIRYFEGGHTGSSYTPMPKYLEDIIVKQKQVMDLNAYRYTKRNVTLNYYELKDEYTSPVLSGTNASTIGIFGSDTGYETVIRSLAEKDNLNSKKVIPIKLGKFVDKYSLSDLNAFDMLYLYDWDYKNDGKAFRLLTNYLYAGRKVFVETGVETKKSSGDLPEIFPVKKVQREGLGKEWGLENVGGVFGHEVDFPKFSPPVFDDDEWKMSYASTDDVVSGAQVILKNHGKVVMASQKVGSGEIIWSGLNFAYHLSRNHNEDEAKFFVNLLSSLVDLNAKPLPESKVDFISPNDTSIETNGARGILFKEMAYDGWSAQISEGDKRGSVRIFKAGPAYPGFMYVQVTPGRNVVKFSYKGSLRDGILMWLSFLAFVLVFEEVVFKGFILGRASKFAYRVLSAKVGGWWQREEEE